MGCVGNKDNTDDDTFHDPNGQMTKCELKTKFSFKVIRGEQVCRPIGAQHYRVLPNWLAEIMNAPEEPTIPRTQLSPLNKLSLDAKHMYVIGLATSVEMTTRALCQYTDKCDPGFRSTHETAIYTVAEYAGIVTGYMELWSGHHKDGYDVDVASFRQWYGHHQIIMGDAQRALAVARELMGDEA